MTPQIPADWQPRMMKLIAELSNVKAETIKPEHRLREDLGMDSVSSLELISMLAEEFGLDITVEEAAHVATVKGAFELALAHLEKRKS